MLALFAFSIQWSQGYVTPSRRYVTETVMPKIWDCQEASRGRNSRCFPYKLHKWSVSVLSRSTRCIWSLIFHVLNIPSNFMRIWSPVCEPSKGCICKIARFLSKASVTQCAVSETHQRVIGLTSSKLWQMPLYPTMDVLHTHYSWLWMMEFSHRELLSIYCPHVER